YTPRCARALAAWRAVLAKKRMAAASLNSHGARQDLRNLESRARGLSIRLPAIRNSCGLNALLECYDFVLIPHRKAPGHGRPGPTVAPRPVDAVVSGSVAGAAGGFRVEGARGSGAYGRV